MATVGKFGEFDIKEDDFQIYCERLEQFFISNKIVDEKVKVANLLSQIGINSYTLLRNLCYPNLPKDKSFEELCDMLKEHCCPKSNVWKERKRFYEITQAENEKIADYYVRITSHSVNCGFGARLSNVIKDKFITGLRKGNVFDRLVEEKETTTLEELKNLAMKKETEKTEKDINFMRRNSRNEIRNEKSQTRNNENRRGHSSSNRGRDARFQGNAYEKKTCQICGKLHGGFCKYKNYVCSTCDKKGHLAKMCKAKNKRVNFINEHVSEDDNDIQNALPMFYVSNFQNDQYQINVQINNINFGFVFDSGSSVSCINKNIYREHFCKQKLCKDDVILRSYNGGVFVPIGYMLVNIKYNNTIKRNKLYVINGGVCNILGRDFMENFNLKFKLVNQINSHSTEVNELVNKYPEVFSDKLGLFKFAKISLNVDPNAKPVFCRPRPIPLAYRKLLDEQLDNMIAEGILTPTQTSEWSTPLVPILKSDGKLRICADYKVTVNKYLSTEVYSLPLIEELFAKLHDGEHFTKLDLFQAYNQFELDENAKKLLVWSTHKGLFTINRMPYGISPASAKFQKYIEQIFMGMDNVIVFMDDILITGKNKKDHLETLEKVIEKLKEAGLTVKKEKCQFFKSSVNYLGFKISKNGLEKDESKVKAVIEAPDPTNVSETRSLLGMINFYSKFIPNLADILKPIYNLLKKGAAFNWNTQCSEAMKKIKEVMSSDMVLTHFNPNLELIVTCDASDVGISGVLSHKMPNGEERPISFISRTLQSAELKYSVIHKEALAIYFSINKFYQYLCSRKFILRTDHRPLVGLFGENKGIPKNHENRIQRWAAYLSGFNYRIEYIKGTKNVVADYFSRAPVKRMINDIEDKEGSYINFTYKVDDWPIDYKRVHDEMKKDMEMMEIVKYVEQDKWPKKIEKNMEPYVHRKSELHTENGILIFGLRIVIPRGLQKKILEEIHAGHFGICKMKSLARSYVWWPTLDKDIEDIAKACDPCLRHKQSPPKTSLSSWTPEEQPWSRIHIDFLGPFKGRHFLLIIDSFSKWLEAFEMKNITTDETIEKLRETFARYGLPRTVVSDNGSSITSDKFEKFLRCNGIVHIKSPPGNQRSNGQCEIAVKLFKNKMKTFLEDPVNKNEKLTTLVSRFLFNYRNIEHASTKKTPARIMFGRETRTRLSLLKTNASKDTKDEHKETRKQLVRSVRTQKKGYRGIKRILHIGDTVMVADYRRTNEKTWTEAKIERRIGRSIYLCRLENGQLWKRHIDQIHKRQGEERGRSMALEETGNANNSSNMYCKIGYNKDRMQSVLQNPSVVTGNSNSDVNIENEPIVTNMDDNHISVNMSSNCVNSNNVNASSSSCKVFNKNDKVKVDEISDSTLVNVTQDREVPSTSRYGRIRKVPSKYDDYVREDD